MYTHIYDEVDEGSRIEAIGKGMGASAGQRAPRTLLRSLTTSRCLGLDNVLERGWGWGQGNASSFPRF